MLIRQVDDIYSLESTAPYSALKQKNDPCLRWTKKTKETQFIFKLNIFLFRLFDDCVRTFFSPGRLVKKVLSWRASLLE